MSLVLQVQEDSYETVEGLDPQTVKLKREYEAQVEAKVASDYNHIIWAYGIIWSIFAIYGAWLWFRTRKLQEDIDQLRQAKSKS